MTRVRSAAHWLAASALFLFVHPGDSLAQTRERPPVVAGTHVRLEVPAGWTRASNFLGFRHARSSSTVVVTELPMPVSEAEAAMGPPDPEERSSHSPLRKSGERQDGIDVEVCTRLVGNGETTAVIVATYPASERDGLGVEIQRALRSAEFDPDAQAKAEDSLTFTIEAGPLRPAVVSHLGCVYSPDGELDRGPPKTTLLIACPLKSSRPLSRRSSAIQTIRLTTDVQSFETRSVAPVVIDHLPGFVVTGTFQKKGTEFFARGAVLFEGSSPWVLLGSCPASEAGESDPLLERALESFTRKHREFEIPETGCRLRLPATWSALESRSELLVAGHLPASLVVRVESHLEEPGDLDLLVEFTRHEVREATGASEPPSPRETRIGTIPARQIAWAETTEEEETVCYSWTVFRTGNRVHRILIGVAKDALDHDPQLPTRVLGGWRSPR